MHVLKQRVKRFGKNAFYKIRGAPREFDPRMLPWIDGESPDIEGFRRRFPKAAAVPYDLAAKLRAWRENGYVTLERVISAAWLDQLSKEIDEFLEHLEPFETTIIVSDKPGNQKAKNVSREAPKAPGIRVNHFYELPVAAKTRSVISTVTASRLFELLQAPGFGHRHPAVFRLLVACNV